MRWIDAEQARCEVHDLGRSRPRQTKDSGSVTNLDRIFASRKKAATHRIGPLSVPQMISCSSWVVCHTMALPRVKSCARLTHRLSNWKKYRMSFESGSRLMLMTDSGSTKEAHVRVDRREGTLLLNRKHAKTISEESVVSSFSFVWRRTGSSRHWLPLT